MKNVIDIISIRMEIAKTNFEDMTMDAATTAVRPASGRGDWSLLIDDVCAGRWIDPDTGRAAEVPFHDIVIADRLAGSEGALIERVMPAESYAIVADEATWEVYGRAIAEAVGPRGRDVVLTHPHADEGEARRLAERTKGVEALIAVGSGTLNDLCKYVTAKDGRAYSVFGTAPSMNGYTSTTASITLDSGLKTTQSAHAAKGVFLDIGISAAAPQYLIAAGFGDSLCRPTAQVDWYFSHALFGTRYATSPYALQERDEAEMLARSAGLGARDPEAVGYLHRILTLGGLGISVVGMSHPGSMGEHQISHWIDSFAGERHPGTVHGQQVGVASVAMARLQEWLLGMETAPRVRPSRLDEAEIRARYPAAAVEDCLKACRAKALDEAKAAQVNADLDRIWPELRRTLSNYAMPSAEIASHIRAAGGGAMPAEIGMDPELFRDALRHCREMRDRYSMLDLADDMGVLEDFIAEEY
jgi:glycerol-1-phosphate dehydrogenase [NAD(P)+]